MELFLAVGGKASIGLQRDCFIAVAADKDKACLGMNVRKVFGVELCEISEFTLYENDLGLFR